MEQETPKKPKTKELILKDLLYTKNKLQVIDDQLKMNIQYIENCNKDFFRHLIRIENKLNELFNDQKILVNSVANLKKKDNENFEELNTKIDRLLEFEDEHEYSTTQLEEHSKEVQASIDKRYFLIDKPKIFNKPEDELNALEKDYIDTIHSHIFRKIRSMDNFGIKPVNSIKDLNALLGKLTNNLNEIVVKVCSYCEEFHGNSGSKFCSKECFDKAKHKEDEIKKQKDIEPVEFEKVNKEPKDKFDKTPKELGVGLEYLTYFPGMSTRLWHLLYYNFPDRKISSIKKNEFRTTRGFGKKSWDEYCDIFGIDPYKN